MFGKLLIGFVASVCVAAAVAGEPGRTGARPGVVDAADFAAADSPTGGIQEAVDALPGSGGEVIMPAGEYALRRSVRLRSNVTLQGAGPGTVLRKTKQAETRLAAVALKGSRSVRVENPAGFAEGDQVAIRDGDAQGWNVVQAMVAGVEGNELLLDRPMPRTCDSAKGGFVVHAFPALEASGASNVVIKDLSIRDDNLRDLSIHGPLDLGDPRTKWVFIVPFPVAAVSLVDATDSRVEGVFVVGWLSDGISIQRGANNTVVKCLAENCGGNGFHPGGGLHDSVFSHNVARGNYYAGLFFCANVQRVTVSDNEFVGNKGNGVGGLGEAGDKHNTVADNLCADNGLHGIQMSNGDNNTVTGNACRNNSQSAPGEYSGIWLQKTSLSVVKGNRCFDDQQTKTQKHGIEELPDCRANTIAGNDCHGNAQADLVLAADQPQPAAPKESTSGRPGRSAAPAGVDRPQPAVPRGSPRGRGQTSAGLPAANEKQPAVPTEAGPPEIVDYTDPTYGAKVRQLRKDDGHEHNFYYYRDPWNADGTRMLGIQCDLQQKHWRVCLYDGDGVFLKELFPIEKYDWRLCWDRNDPDVLYTWKGSELYRFRVAEGRAELLKSFAPLSLMSNGPSCNQGGDRILVITSDRTFRSYRLPDMGDERTFQIAVPEGCFVAWDKPQYIGCRNYIDTAYRGSSPGQGAIVVYDDTGEVVHRFDSIGAGGHYDYSPDGKLAYFKLPTGGRGAPERPLEIRVVNLDGSGDRVLFSVPREQARFHNLHLSWPRKVDDWFVAGFFPSAASPAARTADQRAPAGYEPPLDEILMIRLDGTTRYLARTGTVYFRAAGRGGLGDMFWAQTLPRPSADGRRISFNSNRSGTIDLHILYVGESRPGKD